MGPISSLLSLLDPLTGIPNRRAFDARLTALYDLHRMTGREFSLLMIDVDHFKFFNDHYGHLDGDACLRAIADILRRLDLKHDDMIARLACMAPSDRGAMPSARTIASARLSAGPR